MSEEMAETPEEMAEAAEEVVETSEEVFEAAEEVVEAPAAGEELTQDDKLWGLLCWLPWIGWIIDIVALLIEPQKNRPFIRYNAVQALAMNIILAVLSAILSPTCVGSILVFALWLVTLYWGFKAYQGERVQIPFVTEFCKNQNWIQ